jgi:preprotein translocase subunit SecD
MHMGGDPSKPYYLVKTGEPLLTQRDLSTAYGAADQSGTFAIGFGLDAVGTQTFVEITQKNVGWSLAVIIGGVLRCAPVILGPLVAGSGVIEGHLTQQEVDDLVPAIQSTAGKP